MKVDKLAIWFKHHCHDVNYQHRGMPIEIMAAYAQASFFRMTQANQNKVLAVCRAYGVVTDDPLTMQRMFLYRYMAQTNLFALCHLLEKYKDTTDKTYVWTDGVTHNTHEEICNDFFVCKNPLVLTFKDFATNYVDQKERLLLVPRGGFKSSIDMADCIQWIINWPEVTIMILTGVLDLAVDFVKEIKSHFTLDDGACEGQNLYETKKAIKPRTMADGSPFMFQVLFAEHCIAKDDGTQQEFQTPAASLIDKESTLFAASIDQNLSGWHVGVMKLDDVVTNENSRTVERIKNINKQVSINKAMRVPYGFYDVIGTWYDSDDVYGQIMKHVEKCIKNGDPVQTKVYLRPAWWPNLAAVKAGKVESEMIESDWELWFNVPGQLTYAFLKAERYSVWWTRCDCGKEKEASTGTLRAGKSCGCLSREISGESRRLPFGIAARNACLGGYKAGAYKREITWNLSDRRFDELTSSDCHYCGIPPNQKSYSSRRESGVYVYNGIDRVDNSRGYEPDNVVSCCKVCNRAKDTMTVEEFLSWIERIHNVKSKTAESHELTLNQKQKPQTVGVSGPGPFKGTRAGEKRAGSTKYQDYPGELGSNPAYKGGVGDCK